MFAADWRAASRGRPPAARWLIDRLADGLRGSEQDPLGATLSACPGRADFEVLSRLV